ncbi:unannotated protein [freshwater metagenome]|uniref:Unannotated protein n=1 Tax=freshwater metagenome TaxID=449393 RepID=A0A6J7MBV1_9ZZZZ
MAAFAVDACLVSMLMIAPLSRNFSITGKTRDCSSSAETRAAPGRVDSPPISMMSTPSEIICNARLTANSVLLKRPPSAKESGVTLRIPMTIIRSLGNPRIVMWSYRFVIRLIASARVVESRNTPRTALVTVRACVLRTPRIDIQRCSHSIITMTPAGLRISTIASAI